MNKRSIPWDAARVASRRPTRKYKEVAPVVGTLKHTHDVCAGGLVLYGGEIQTCQGCGFHVCACNTNRKFDGGSLEVTDVMLGKVTESGAHTGEVFIITEIDVRRVGDAGPLGVRGIDSFGGDERFYRYGYLRDEFECTDFGACARHRTVWDYAAGVTECGHCKNEVTYALDMGLKFEVIALNEANAEQAKVATEIVNEMCKGKELQLPLDPVARQAALNLLLTGDVSGFVPEPIPVPEAPSGMHLYFERAREKYLEAYRSQGLNSVARGELCPECVGANGTHESRCPFSPKSGRNYKFPVQRAMSHGQTANIPDDGFIVPLEERHRVERERRLCGCRGMQHDIRCPRNPSA